MGEQEQVANTNPTLRDDHGTHRVVSGLVALVCVGILSAVLWYLYGDRVAVHFGRSTERGGEALATPPPVPESLPALPETMPGEASGVKIIEP